MKRLHFSKIMLIAGVVSLVTPLGTHAQDRWSGEVGVSLIGLSSSGSEESFLTQMNLTDGFNLETLRLEYAGDERGKGDLVMEAWGFGGAVPHEHASILYRTKAPLTLGLDYDRRSSFFSLAETELGLRSDEWEITSWKGRLSWDGWPAARLVLDLRRVERDGVANRPFYGLNDIFPLRVDFDESMSEAALRIESSTLPVKLTFEQAYAVFERANRYSPGEGEYNDNPNDLADVTTTRNDEISVPTSFLTAAYSGERVDFAAAALYSPAELDTEGLTSSTFAIGGGSIGQLAFVDDLMGSADRDTVSADVRFGVLFGRGLSLRLAGAWRDTTTDGDLLGQRIIRATNPAGGVFDLTGPLGNTTIFDTTDANLDASMEWSSGGWSVWAGGFTGSREVSWDLEENETFEVERDADGFIAGLAWRGTRVSVDADYRSDTFERYVFRTEPENVDRFTLRVRGDLGKGWTLHVSGYGETADNPTAVAGLDRESNGYAAGAAWSSRSGVHGFGLDVDRADLTTETGLVLPTGEPGESIYDLSLLTTSVWGRTAVGKVRLDGSLVLVEDSGETWPIESLVGKARIAFPLPANTEVALFGEHWSYEEERGGSDDFDVTRYGVTLTWRFE